MRLMLVDDEVRFLSTAKKLLFKMGYEALTAGSGEEALDILRANPVHVVILDIKMPGMDGIETLKAIKREFPLVEVILLTGHGTVESTVTGLRSGAADYLAKPADITKLIEKAEEAFDKRMRLEEKIRIAQALECQEIAGEIETESR